MLSQVYLGKNFLVPQEIDLHQHAMVSCSFSKKLARVVAAFSRIFAKQAVR